MGRRRLCTKRPPGSPRTASPSWSLMRLAPSRTRPWPAPAAQSCPGCAASPRAAPVRGPTASRRAPRAACEGRACPGAAAGASPPAAPLARRPGLLSPRQALLHDGVAGEPLLLPALGDRRVDLVRGVVLECVRANQHFWRHLEPLRHLLDRHALGEPDGHRGVL